MRIAYLDCFAGISGDMFLGALVHAGVPPAVLEEATATLGLEAKLKIEMVDRSGISCTKVHVLEGEALAEDTSERQTHLQERSAQGQQVKTHPVHAAGHPHSHFSGLVDEPIEEDRKHVHGRSLTEICALIEKTTLHSSVKAMAIRVFKLLGHSEARIHNVDVEDIHFHEVGAVDAIVDIVAASAGIHYLQVGAWYCSPLNVGGGMVVCAHGTFPVPAPATADLLRGLPTYSAHVQKELITPTGAALLRALNPVFGQQPEMRIETIGYGAGTRNPKKFPNALRLSLGETMDEFGEEKDVVTVLETALDDLSPQVLAWAAESALAEGALDVMLTPVVMKKGRPGTLLTILCEPSRSAVMEALIFRETSTLGIRIRQDRRKILARRHVTVSTEYGMVRIKVGLFEGKEMNAAPEYEDCRAAAIGHKIPVKQVQAAAITAYRIAMQP
jgi:uncharacterized protein (TIGR00299 family) protein